MSVGTDFVAPRGKRTRSLHSDPSGGAGASRRNNGNTYISCISRNEPLYRYLRGRQSAPPDGTLPKNVKTVVTVMPGHLSAACQTSRQHKCENASTLCSGIKPRQRSAGRPPPGPQIPGDADAMYLRPRKGWRAGVLLAPDVGIATCALPRGALALAAIAAVTEAPVVGGRAATEIMAGTSAPVVGGRPLRQSRGPLTAAPVVVGPPRQSRRSLPPRWWGGRCGNRGGHSLPPRWWGGRRGNRGGHSLPPRWSGGGRLGNRGDHCRPDKLGGEEGLPQALCRII